MRFLITGSQRSGTTMLASLLARHPDISVFDEDQSYELLVSEKSEGVFKVPRWGDLLPGPTWGDPDQQMSRPFQWRGEPMLHMVRNPLDVVASMDRLTMSGGVPWLDRYGIPLLKWRLENDSYSRQQVGWVLDLDEVDGRWAYGAAYWWVKNHAAIRHLDAGRPVKVIVYEGSRSRTHTTQRYHRLDGNWRNRCRGAVAPLERSGWNRSAEDSGPISYREGRVITSCDKEHRLRHRGRSIRAALYQNGVAAESEHRYPGRVSSSCGRVCP